MIKILKYIEIINEKLKQIENIRSQNIKIIKNKKVMKINKVMKIIKIIKILKIGQNL